MDRRHRPAELLRQRPTGGKAQAGRRSGGRPPRPGPPPRPPPRPPPAAAAACSAPAGAPGVRRLAPARRLHQAEVLLHQPAGQVERMQWPRQVEALAGDKVLHPVAPAPEMVRKVRAEVVDQQGQQLAAGRRRLGPGGEDRVGAALSAGGAFPPGRPHSAGRFSIQRSGFKAISPMGRAVGPGLEGRVGEGGDGLGRGRVGRGGVGRGGVGRGGLRNGGGHVGGHFGGLDDSGRRQRASARPLVARQSAARPAPPPPPRRASVSCALPGSGGRRTYRPAWRPRRSPSASRPAPGRPRPGRGQ